MSETTKKPVTDGPQRDNHASAPGSGATATPAPAEGGTTAPETQAAESNA
ncbi:hypothetical protein GCM10010420_05610 [Streptomyces glaucosporus]|uniref:Uncharacterized protein n=1 Tax=Streptomyces glaucosporus TaxID=284044 RepID=A0ABP5URI7_9ACTN